jgi:hypothetical protein
VSAGPRLSPRFRGEVAFLIGVAVVLYLVEAGRAEAAVAMLGAWALVVLLEVFRPPRPPAGADAAAQAAAPILLLGEEHELYVAAAAERAGQRDAPAPTVAATDGAEREPAPEAEPAPEPEETYADADVAGR